MTKPELMKIPLKHFGLPTDRKFPMHDEKHLKAAIAYFHTAQDTDRRELAANIVKRHKQLGSNIRISKKNPLFNYVPDNMRKLSETTDLVSYECAKIVHLLDETGKEILEALFHKTGMNTVEDIDSQVPKEYENRDRFIGILKTVIINEDLDGEGYDDYPVYYSDFPVTSKALKKNNGGIMSITEATSLNYDSSKNEIAPINPIKENTHVQFCALLREWNENYIKGIRNFTYDRLMIESWKGYVNDILSEATDVFDTQHIQKLRDLGLYEAEMIDMTADTRSEKLGELGVPNDIPAMDYDNPSSTIFAKYVPPIVSKERADEESEDTSYYTNPRPHHNRH